MEILWDDIGAQEWERLAPLAPLQQSYAYGQAMAIMGLTVRRAVVRIGGQVVALAQILHRAGLRLMSRGPVWVADCDKRAVLRRLARFRGVFLANLDAPLQGFGFVPLVTPRFHATLDLTRETADLRAAMDGKWRNRLVRSEGLVIRRLTPRARDDLAAHEGAQQIKRGYRALPQAFLQGWQGEISGWHWRKGGQIAAGMLFLRHGRAATYHIGWANEEGRAAFAHGPMLWQTMLDLRAEGVERLDLGDVSDRNMGLSRFKLGTGAQLSALGHTVVVLPR